MSCFPSRRSIDQQNRGRRSLSASAEGYADCFVVLKNSRVFSLPSWRSRVFAWRHIHRRKLPAEDDDSFNRHRNRVPKPAKPSAVRYDEFDLAIRRAHDVPDKADRGIIIIKHRQADEIADADGLWKAPVHALFH